MAAPIVLSQLCAVCRTRSPRYECPRCSTKTCSAQCVKQHKKKSQCSGVRDPTTFVKKSQLGTPRGFDHDYNYLTGLERAFDRADREYENRGIHKDVMGDARVLNRLNDLGVRLHRAPKGMSRQKENQTRWRHKQDCIRWTIEWIFPDGSRKLDVALDTLSSRAAYAELQSAYTVNQRKQQKRANKVTQNELRRGAKRRKTRSSLDFKHARDDVELQAILQANAQHGLGNGHDHRTTTPEGETNASLATRDDEDAKDQTLDQDDYAIAANTSTSAQPTPGDEEESDVDIKIENSDQSATEAPQVHFYLLRPFTRGNTKVLCPLDRDEPLGHTLSGHDIFEFPTIYALNQDPQHLPDGFRLEEQCDIGTGRMIREIDEEAEGGLR